ncbi:hypothetical protein LCGC14_0512070 [marine sediment metagenome]|uniref:Uncharacterized protein n=1 Tax=marine sediment metagenome TaxID=412755 RepID=A0A0F9S0X7_9ZZZZ
MEKESKRITVKDLIRVSGFSRDTIVKLATKGSLPFSRDCNNWRIFKPECINIIQKLAGIV